MAEFVQHEPCPKCGSGDNLARYTDGSAYCFSPGCKHFEPGSESAAKETPPAPRSATRHLIEFKGNWDFPVPAEYQRGISQETFRRFGTFHHRINKQDVLVTPVYNKRGIVAYQKIRFLSDKDFATLTAPEETASITTSWMVGRQAYGDGLFRRVETSNVRSRVVIVGGEIDQHTVAQVMARDKFTAVVSPSAGEGSLKEQVGANIGWLSRFDTIVLALDNDEPGRQAMDAAAPFLPPEKLRVVRWEPYKDPNDILVKGKNPGAIAKQIESAGKYVPPGTLTGDDFLRIPLLAAENEVTPAFEWPWPNLESRTEMAFRRGDLIVLLAPTGLGKTTLLYECAAHWLAKGQRIACLFLENDPTEVFGGLLTAAISKPLTAFPNLLTPPEKYEAMKALDWHGRIFVEDPHELPDTLDDLFNKIRALKAVHDIDTILLDPLSALLDKSLPEERGSSRADAIGKKMLQLADLARDLKVTTFVTHHLNRPEGNRGHEEGGEISIKHALGSGGITRYVQQVLAYQAPRRDKGETACKFIAKKCRWRGELKEQVLTHFAFDPKTGRVYEVDGPKSGHMPDDMFTDTEGYDHGKDF